MPYTGAAMKLGPLKTADRYDRYDGGKFGVQLQPASTPITNAFFALSSAPTAVVPDACAGTKAWHIAAIDMLQ